MGLSASSRARPDGARPDKYTGLSGNQKESLQKTWRLLARDRDAHSVKIFVRFFRKYPPYRRYFLDSPGVTMSEIARNPGVRRHCRAFMNELDYLIYVISEKPQIFDAALENLAKVHKDMKIGNKDCKRLNRELVEYMKKEFPMQFDTTEEDNWNQFLTQVKEIFLKKMSELRIEDLAADERDRSTPSSAHSLDSTDNSTLRVLKQDAGSAEKEYWDARRTYWEGKHAFWKTDTKNTSMHIDDEEEDDTFIGSRKKSRFAFFSRFVGKRAAKERVEVAVADVAEPESSGGASR